MAHGLDVAKPVRRPLLDHLQDAIRAAAAVSSRGEPGKPTVNALNGADDVRAIAAAIPDESTPPERNAPTGTSESICLLTVSRSLERVSSTHSFSDTPVRTAIRGFQKRLISGPPLAPM